MKKVHDDWCSISKMIGTGIAGNFRHKLLPFSTKGSKVIRVRRELSSTPLIVLVGCSLLYVSVRVSPWVSCRARQVTEGFVFGFGCFFFFFFFVFFKPASSLKKLLNPEVACVFGWQYQFFVRLEWLSLNFPFACSPAVLDDVVIRENCDRRVCFLQGIRRKC